MLFELHCHSKYSKGTKIPAEGIPSPSEIIRTAKKTGLDGVALTDHDNVRGWKEAKKEAEKQGILFIPGEEIESRKGHILGLGITEHIRPGQSVGETLDKIREQGGVSVAAHPFEPRGKGIKHEMGKADAVEVFNAMSVDRLSNIATERLAKKMGKPMVSGSDAHNLSTLGLTKNKIDAQELEGILKAVKQGKVELTKNYMSVKQILDWNRERVLESRDLMFKYMDENYNYPKKSVGKFLLRKFLNHPYSPFWTALAHLGPPVASVWSGLKLFQYY